MANAVSRITSNTGNANGVTNVSPVACTRLYIISSPMKAISSSP
jgi:hypothetical protein